MQIPVQNAFCNHATSIYSGIVSSLKFTKFALQFKSQRTIPISPAAEVGNLASLDNFFFFTDYFSLGYMQKHPGGCGVLTLGQLKIFKMAAAKRGQICDGDVHFW